MKTAKSFIPCIPARLPGDLSIAAARIAAEHNPANAPLAEMLTLLLAPTPQHIAIMTTKYWGSGGVKLGVSFLDNPTAACRAKILAHMNAWGSRCNVVFQESASQGQVRIARGNSGYWSYLGTDILSIGAGQPTMNLQGFTENTSDSEYKRVVRHETGHTLGCPHEHMRQEIVSLLDVNKTIAYFRANQGWDRNTTIQQVLTPISEQSLMGTPEPEADSIMCYQLPGTITKTGKPIVGGADITEDDFAFIGKLYPRAAVPPVVPPASGNLSLTASVSAAAAVKALQDLGYKVSK